jgi:DNA-directed RNA polymerase subunit beta
MLYAVEDFAHTKVNVGLHDSTNKMVNELIHNYKIKLNDWCITREKLHYCWG